MIDAGGTAAAGQNRFAISRQINTVPDEAKTVAMLARLRVMTPANDAEDSGAGFFVRRFGLAADFTVR